MSTAYAKIPKDILKSNISSDAKVLYACLADRHRLSEKNGWIDDDGRIYVIFPICEIMEVLHCSKLKARKTLAELGDLVERKRRGQGKPDIIYINIFCTADNLSAEFFDKDKSNDLQEDNIVSFKKETGEPSKGLKSDPQEDSKMPPNNNNINKNNINKNYLSNPSYQINLCDWREERNEYTEIIKSNIEYDIITCILRKEYVDEIVSVMVNAVCSTKEFLNIGGENIPKEFVKEKLLKLKSNHIEYVHDCFCKSITRVKNMSAYLLSCLYRAADTMHLHYVNMVNADRGR